MNKPETKLRYLGLLIVFLLIFAFPAAVFSEEEPTMLRVEPDQLVAATCQEHTVAIRVENVADLTSFELKIDFDPAVIEILEVEYGDFLEAPEETLFFPPTNNDGDWNDEGFIRFGMAQQGVGGNPDPKSGEGDLLLITFRPLAPNQTTHLEIDTDESLLVWWGEGGVAPGEGEPVDGSLIEYEAQDGEIQTQNCPPVADPQMVYTLMNTPVNITLTGSDPDGNPLTYELIFPFPQHGVLSGGPLPDVIYTPFTGFVGEDSFTFVVGDGVEFSPPATVTIFVKDILLSNDTILEGEPPGTLVGVFTTLTDKLDSTYTYTLVDGDGDEDNGSFEIVFNPDTGEYELRSTEVFDSTVQQTYSIRVRSTDSADATLFVEKVFIITVLPEPPVGFFYYFPLFTR